jgi:hypothetical protein
MHRTGNLHTGSIHRKIISLSMPNEDVERKMCSGTRPQTSLQPVRGGGRPIKYVARIKYVKYVIRRPLLICSLS